MKRPGDRTNRVRLYLSSGQLRSLHDALTLLVAEHSSDPKRHYQLAQLRSTLSVVESAMAKIATQMAKKSS